MSMIQTHNLGFSCMSAKRELKFALESFWAGKTGADQLSGTAKSVRSNNWQLQQSSGIDLIPFNDFSL